MAKSNQPQRIDFFIVLENHGIVPWFQRGLPLSKNTSYDKIKIVVYTKLIIIGGNCHEL